MLKLEVPKTNEKYKKSKRYDQPFVGSPPWVQFTAFMSFPSALMDRLAKWAIPAGIAFTGVSSSIYTGKTLKQFYNSLKLNFSRWWTKSRHFR